MSHLENNTIQLSISHGTPYFESKRATSPIMPGMLIEYTPDEDGEVRPHDGEVGADIMMYAIENIYHGGTIYDEYQIGDRVHFVIPRAGDRILAWLMPLRASVYGEPLVSSDNGYLKNIIVPPDAGSIAGVALESNDNTHTEVIRVPILAK